MYGVDRQSAVLVGVYLVPIRVPIQTVLCAGKIARIGLLACEVPVYVYSEIFFLFHPSSRKWVFLLN